MQESEHERPNGSRCRATNRRGEPCGKRAVNDGLCLVHAGAQDMRKLGAKGGSVRPLTKLRKAADDELREQARQVLADAMAGKAVDKQQLDAARSLFAYRAVEAPREAREHERVETRPVPRATLANVLDFAATEAQGVLENPELVTALERAHAKAQELKAHGRVAVPDGDGDAA
jgi:hypothetical protein